MAQATTSKRVAEIAAWNNYLERTKDCDPIRYREVEAWAWRHLQHDLKGTK